MRRPTVLTILFCLSLSYAARATEETIETMSDSERNATVKLTRLRSARLWWKDKNRVIGVAFKGIDANDQSLALVGQLPAIRTLVLLALPENQLTNDGLSHLRHIPQLELLSISGSRVTDAGLVHLLTLDKLRALTLNGPFTNYGLETISQLKDLELLNLTQTNVTDEGLNQLVGLSKLNTLILNGTPITNEGVKIISQMKNIDQLYLSNTAVDDSAVELLKSMTQLRTLTILDTGVTKDGLNELQSALSGECWIHHNSGTVHGTGDEGLDLADVHRSGSTWRASR